MKKISLILALAFSLTTTFADDEATVTVTAKNCDNTTPCYVIKSSASVLSQAINQDVNNKQAISMIQNSIVPQIDFTLMAKLAMGANWKTASADQQTQITNLFKQMLINTYASALSKFKGAAVTINNSTISADNPNKGIVASTISMQKGDKSQPINVEYDLAKLSGNWKIYDVKIENASIVTTYRSQFNDIIQKNGVDGLIAQLQTKVDSINKKQ